MSKAVTPIGDEPAGRLASEGAEAITGVGTRDGTMNLRRIPNLPDWAESHFAVLCDEQNVTRNRSTQDRAGWDYIVDFEPEPEPGLPIDRRSGGVSARIQIKSKTGGRPRAEMKLSNALRFCREPSPCFVVLMHRSKDGGPVGYYVREFDRDLMASTLRHAREADRDGQLETNHIRIVVPFDREHLTEDPVGLIREHAMKAGSEYGQRKRRLNDTLGFERAAVSGTITFAAKDVVSLIEHGVGLKPDFEVDHVVLRDQRFEIPARVPIFEGKPTFFSLSVAARPARIVVSGQGGREASFRGEFRSFNLPGCRANITGRTSPPTAFRRSCAAPRSWCSTTTWRPRCAVRSRNSSTWSRSTSRSENHSRSRSRSTASMS